MPIVPNSNSAMRVISQRDSFDDSHWVADNVYKLVHLSIFWIALNIAIMVSRYNTRSKSRQNSDTSTDHSVSVPRVNSDKSTTLRPLSGDWDAFGGRFIEVCMYLKWLNIV